MVFIPCALERVQSTAQTRVGAAAACGEGGIGRGATYPTGHVRPWAGSLPANGHGRRLIVEQVLGALQWLLLLLRLLGASALLLLRLLLLWQLLLGQRCVGARGLHGELLQRLGHAVHWRWER
jgi:hypothetical protein